MSAAAFRQALEELKQAHAVLQVGGEGGLRKETCMRLSGTRNTAGYALDALCNSTPPSPAGRGGRLTAACTGGTRGAGSAAGRTRRGGWFHGVEVWEQLGGGRAALQAELTAVGGMEVWEVWGWQSEYASG